LSSLDGFVPLLFPPPSPRRDPLLRSKVVVKKSAADVYAALIDDKVAIKMGPGDWSPNHSGVRANGKELKMASSGFQYAVWEAQP
jgi:alpha-amylase